MDEVGGGLPLPWDPLATRWGTLPPYHKMEDPSLATRTWTSSLATSLANLLFVTC